MRNAIKLVFVYLGIQLLMGIVISVIGILLRMAGYEDVSSMLFSPSLLLSMGLMFFYLYRGHYIPFTKAAWSGVSFLFLLFTVIMALSSILLTDFVSSCLSFLPNLLKNTFNLLSMGWLGLLLIAIVGPVFEEMLFRGAVTRLLLKEYCPKKAILLSALIFGIFHLNPAQVVPAFLIGLVLAWLYYLTDSMIPGIIVHILNNSISVFVGLQFPKAETFRDVSSEPLYGILCAFSLVVLILSLYLLSHIKPLDVPCHPQKPKG